MSLLELAASMAVDDLEPPGRASSLDERIVAAFAGGVRSGDVADLVREVEAAAVAAQEVAEAARALALDPLTPPAQERAARDRMADCAFRFDRLMVARARLDERRRELEAHENNDRRRVAYDAAVAERDRIAEELADYPAIVEKLVKLFAALAQNNLEITRVNAQLPDGAAWVEPAERVAKGQVGQPLDRRDMSVLECRLAPWWVDAAARWPPDRRFG
jgi:hypothetical protein